MYNRASSALTLLYPLSSPPPAEIAVLRRIYLHPVARWAQNQLGILIEHRNLGVS